MYSWLILCAMLRDENGGLHDVTEVTIAADTEVEAVEKAGEVAPGRRLYFVRASNEIVKETISEFQKMYLSNMEQFKQEIMKLSNKIDKI